jgi:hypothetical protein
MKSKTIVLAMAAVLVLTASPVALGGWRGLDARNNLDGSQNGHLSAISGSDEPNTKYDDATHMYQTKNLDTKDKLYLDLSVQTISGVLAGLIIPHNWQLPSRHLIDSNQIMYAFLGFWRDCNGDGYIGLSETGESEYPAALSIALNKPISVACAAEPYAQTIAGQIFIDEFRAIGPDATNQGGSANAGSCIFGTHEPAPDSLCLPIKRDKRDIDDGSARVWMDWKAPDEFPPLMHQGLLPYPPGTFTSTDGTTKWVDDATTSHAVKNAYNSIPGLNWATRPCLGESDRSDLNGQDTDNGESDPSNPWTLASVT